MDSSYSVSELSYQMSNYSIQQPQHYPSASYQSSSPPPSECSSPSAADSTFSFPESSAMVTPASSAASSAASSRSNTYQVTNVRAQRQRALRQQCSSSHLADIADLVSRMVNTGEQCSVGTRSSTPPPPPPPSHTTASTSPSHGPIRLARQGSDASDGSVSPFSRISYGEDENMTDHDEYGQFSETESTGTAEDYDGTSSPTFGDWGFSWGAGRSKAGESAAERKGCITKDTRSRKHMRRR